MSFSRNTFPITFRDFFPWPRHFRSEESSQVGLQREPVADALRRRGVVSNTMDQLVDGAAEERIPLTPAQRVELAAMLDRLPEQFYRGTGELIGPEYLKPALRNHLTASLEQARYWLAAILSSFDRLRPQCVVSTSYSSLPGRAAAVACRRFDGTSVYLQHGLFPDRSFFTRFCNDVLLLWGDSNRRFMIEQGIPADRVHVVGASNYDELIARSRESAAKSVPKPAHRLSSLSWPREQPVRRVSYSAAEACLANVARAVAEIPFARLIAKVHPGDKTGMVERTVGELPSCTIVKSGNSQDVILESDIVIVVSSTTGLEACVADKPLIVLEPVGFPSFGTYAQYGAALMVPLNGDRDWERIADAIQRLQSDPAIVGDLAPVAAGSSTTCSMAVAAMRLNWPPRRSPPARELRNRSQRIPCRVYDRKRTNSVAIASIRRCAGAVSGMSCGMAIDRDDPRAAGPSRR